MAIRQKPKLQVVILQHSDDTPPGSVLAWLEGRGHAVDLRPLHRGAALPRQEEVDWLVVLGGGMNVDETTKYPWLEEEKLFLQSVLDAGKTCLGLCLGGQLIAQVLGGSVRKNAHWEVGWHPVRLASGEKLVVFQFHQDTFSLPPGAEGFATNDITRDQAFRFGHRVVATQFHPESTREWVDSLMKEDPYPTGPYVQSPTELGAGVTKYLPAMQRWFFELLEHMEKTAG